MLAVQRAVKIRELVMHPDEIEGAGRPGEASETRCPNLNVRACFCRACASRTPATDGLDRPP